MTAAWLAQVGAGDAHPLVGRGVGEHPLQRFPIARLQLGASGKVAAGHGDPVGQRIAHPFQLTEADNPRQPRARRNLGVDLNPAKALREEAGKLTLEAADLTAQFSARTALVPTGPT